MPTECDLQPVLFCELDGEICQSSQHFDGSFFYIMFLIFYMVHGFMHIFRIPQAFSLFFPLQVQVLILNEF